VPEPEPEPKPVPGPVCAKVAIVEAARKAAAAVATVNVCTFMVPSAAGMVPASRANASLANAVPLRVEWHDLEPEPKRGSSGY
jgi:hypothetical protein